MTLLLFFVIYLFGFGININSYAQADTCNTKLNVDYLKSYYHASVYSLKQVPELSVNHWILTSIGAGTVLWTYSQDPIFYNRVYQPEKGMSSTASLLAEGWGSGLTALPVLAGMYTIGLINENPQLQHAALSGFQAFVISAGAAWTIKQLTQRPRPEPFFDPAIWHGPFAGGGHDAFPSGHTMRAFALATVLAGVYHDKTAWGLAFYGLAAITAYTRLKSGEHWPSDVVAGALIGFGIGRAVLAFNRKKSMHYLQPSVSNNGLGIVYKIQ